MTQPTDDQWLDVLAGRAAPADADTRQAASLREFFELQAQHTPTPDEATRRRMMNMLAAKGAFAEASSTPTPRQNPLRQLMAWLLPPDNAHPGRWAAVAVAVFAITVIPFVLQSPDPADDPYGIKSLPFDPNLNPTVIHSSNPAQDAAQLQAQLSIQGVMATLRSEGTSVWVQARVPTDKHSAVQAMLSPLGLSTPPDGQLVVQFRAQP